MSDGGPPTVPPTATEFPRNQQLLHQVLECPLLPRLLFHPGGKLFQKGQQARANSTQCLNSHWHDGVGWGKAAVLPYLHHPSHCPSTASGAWHAGDKTAPKCLGIINTKQPWCMQAGGTWPTILPQKVLWPGCT